MEAKEGNWAVYRNSKTKLMDVHQCEGIKKTENCVYCILCKPNGKMYIGVSKNPWHRKATHEYNLRHRKGNYAQHFIEDFESYGEGEFVFFILAVVQGECRDALEKYFIDKYKTDDFNYGYNRYR